MSIICGRFFIDGNYSLKKQYVVWAVGVSDLSFGRVRKGRFMEKIRRNWGIHPNLEDIRVN